MLRYISRLLFALTLVTVATSNLWCSGLEPPPPVALNVDISGRISKNEIYKHNQVAKEYFDKMCRKIRRYWHPSKGYRQAVVVRFGLYLDGNIDWLTEDASCNRAAVEAIKKAAPFGPAPANLGAEKVAWYYITLTF
jgi:hypothetical protein